MKTLSMYRVSGLMLLFTAFSLHLTVAQTVNSNFYNLQQKYQKQFKRYEKEERNERAKTKSTQKVEENEQGGYEIYKRWESFNEPRVFPSGNSALPYQAATNFQNYRNDLSANRITGANSNLVGCNTPWLYYGPTTNPGGEGVGRVNFVRFMPGNNNTLFIGTPVGGLWKSTNGGASWQNLTDFLQLIGCSDLAIDPTNTNIMYLATGDADHFDTESIGVWKSIDGGITWNPTSLTFNLGTTKRISKLLINPSNTSIILAATTDGVYRSTNAGSTWTLATGTSTAPTYPSIRDLAFKPGNPNIVYACNTELYRSTNGGQTFTQITNGVPSSASLRRMSIAVTPANPNYVYLLTTDITNYAFEGLYRSTNSGLAFTQQSTINSSGINILGWDPFGGDTGGQGWYTLSIAVSNTNADSIWCGGVNVWASGDGGVNWNLSAHWYGGNGAPYVHADIHALLTEPGTVGRIWAACDGGIYYTTDNGVTWNDQSQNLPIGQVYGIGLSATDTSFLVGGFQDNGTSSSSNGSWSKIMGGDGMLCFIDYSTNQTIYAEYYNGNFHISTNGGASFNNISISTTEAANWVTPWLQDPQTPHTIYAGLENVWKSTDQGNTWNIISGSASMGSGTFVALNVAKSNPNYIYAAKKDKLWKTSNGGSSWTDITAGLPVANAEITDIEIDPALPNKIWITFSGYSASDKIYASTNGGSSWINLSTGLPNLPCNTVAFRAHASGSLYVGMDVGVYTRDSLTNLWALLNNQLPNVVIADLQVYPAAKQLRAATFGRGVWIYDYTAQTPPSAAFTSTILNTCTPMQVQLNNNSLNGVSYAWSFPGAAPSSSTAANPTVTYTNAGNFNIQLIVSNSCNSDTLLLSNAVQLTATNITPTAAFTVNDSTQCLAGNNFAFTNTSSGGNLLSWNFGEPASGAANISASTSPTHTYLTTGNYLVTLKDSVAGGCSSTFQKHLLVSAADTSRFTISNNSGCTPIVASLSNQSVGAPTTIHWLFPGGTPTSSTAANPAVTYTAIGNYNITLITANACEADTVVLSNAVQITAANSTPVITAACADTNQCLNGNSFQFSSNAGSTLIKQWTFGDGQQDTSSNCQHSYASAGYYTVQLTAATTAGCSDNANVLVHVVSPISVGAISGATTAQINQPISYSVTNQVGIGFHWIVSGGTLISGQGTNFVSIQWNTVGTGTIKVYATAACSDTTTKHLDLLNGITEVSSANEITLHTLVVGTKYALRMNNPEQVWDLTLYDALGQVISTAQAIRNEAIIDLANSYAVGVYLAVLHNQNGQQAQFKLEKR